MGVVEYVMVRIEAFKVATILRDDDYFGSLFMAFDDRNQGPAYGDNMPHIVVAYPDSANLNQLSVFAPKFQVAETIESLARLERKPF